MVTKEASPYGSRLHIKYKNNTTRKQKYYFVCIYLNYIEKYSANPQMFSWSSGLGTRGRSLGPGGSS